jgi:hypothetical protein
MRKRIMSVLALSLALASLTAVMSPAMAWERGTEGCTPGYWKNHPEAWVGYSPSQTVASVFDGEEASLSDATLIEALGFKGGSNLVGAERILLRASVASLLSASSDIDYGYGAARVINSTNRALLSDSRSRILKMAAEFDRLNNRGCPL